jgi:hypothetical protein
MGLRDRVTKLAADAVEVARSEETHNKLAKAKDKVVEVAASDTTKKVLRESASVGFEVLDHLGDGDAPLQAVAKTTKKRLTSGPKELGK